MRALLLHLLVHFFHIRTYRVLRNAERAQQPRSGDHGLDVDDIPGIDGEHGRNRSVVVAPDDGIGRRLQAVSPRLGEQGTANRAN
jgi:hypothetical protein